MAVQDDFFTVDSADQLLFAQLYSNLIVLLLYIKMD